MTSTSTARLFARVKDERDWIEHCGGNLAGYILKYGSVMDPDHSGDGAEAIYAADLAALRRAEEALTAAMERGR